jgi:hypothetical protein
MIFIQIGQVLLERINAIPIRIPPTTNKGVMCSLKKRTLSRVPTTGCAKNVSEAAPASSTEKAVFHKYIARAVEMIPRNKMPPTTQTLIVPSW